MRENISIANVNSILYIGASVTAQKNGYRSELNSLLENNYGNEIKETVVATGATGSLFALCNLSEIKLDADYDLAIIEYSTGDLNLGLTPLDMIENVIQQLVTKLNSIAKSIVILHNYRSDFEDKKGDIVRQLYNNVAERCGIPVINNAKMIESLKLSMTSGEFSLLYRDNVHSTPAGSKLVAQYIFEGLVNLGDIPKHKNFQDSESFASMYKLVDIIHRKDGDYVYPATQQIFPFVSFKKGEKLEVLIKGELWGLVSIVGPKSSWVRGFTNEEQIVDYAHFDQHCYYTRVQPRIIRRTYNEFTKLTFEITDKEIDASICKEPHKDHLAPRQASYTMFMGRNLEFM